MAKTGGAPGLASSSVIMRPRRGGTSRNVKVLGEDDAVELLGAFSIVVKHVGVVTAHDVFEDVVLVAVVEHLGHRVAGTAAGTGFLHVMNHEVDQAVAALVGKRVEKAVVNHAEDERGCTDAQAESEGGQESEAAIFAQAAKPVAKVSQKMVDEIPHALLPVLALYAPPKRNGSGVEPVATT